MILRPIITRPQASVLQERSIIDGFTKTINLFASLSMRPSSWTAAGFVTPISLNEENKETDVDEFEVIEYTAQIQRVENLITRQWLQANMWKWASRRSSNQYFVADEPWSVNQPLAIGKEVIRVLECCPRILADAWGIALVSFLMIVRYNQFLCLN
jgi:hypothetical protein